jgi:hypothetical protein
MSYKLSELQDIAEKKGLEYAKPMVCLHTTLYAVNDALKGVDKVTYVSPDITKASNGILAGLWSSEGTCGIAIAGGMAISIKHGSSDPYDGATIYSTGMKAREFYNWFKQEFGSCTCFDLSKVKDWGDPEAIEWYRENTQDVCMDAIKGTVRKLVDVLTVDNPKVLRDE